MAEIVPVTIRPKLSGEIILLAAVGCLVAAISLYPLGALLAEAFQRGGDGFAFGLIREAWLSRSVQRALANTLLVALASSLVSLAYGVFAAALIRLTDCRGKVLLTFLFLLPMLIPSQIMALAWIELLGPAGPAAALFGLSGAEGRTNPLYSFGGIVWVMGLEHGGLVMIATMAGLKAIPRDLVEAARIGGAGALQITRRIILPLALPSVLAGTLLAFVSSIGNFGVPALLGIPGRYTMLTTLIYQRLNGFGPSVLGEVAAIALILVALAAFGLMLEYMASHRLGARIDRTGQSFDGFATGRLAGLFTFLGYGAAVFLALLPLAALIAASLTPALGVRLTWDTISLANYAGLFSRHDSVTRAVINSLLLASGAAFFTAALAIILAYLGHTRRWRLARLIDQGASLPYAVPGTVLALGIIIAFLPPLPLIGLSLYGTLAIIFVAYVARFLPLALRPVAAGMVSLDPALDEAAAVVGASPLRRLLAIIGPLALPAAMAGALMVFITAINELTVSVLLTAAGTQTIGVSIFALQYEGNSPAAAALSVISIAITLLIAFLIDRLARHAPAAAVMWR